MLAYMYHSNGAPIMFRNYTSPGRHLLEQAEVRLEKAIGLGDTQLVHMGHGVYHRFKCVAVDADYALLQNCTE